MTAEESERAAVDYLLSRAQVIELRLRELVALRRAEDPAPDDPFRGLYLSDETVDRLLAELPRTSGFALDSELRAAVEEAADDAESGGAGLRLRALTRAAGLTEVDVELLLVALLPDLDVRFEKLYGYLNDDVTRRRPSIGIALQLAGESPMSAAARARLDPSLPLVRFGLVVVEDAERPFLSRGLRVPDRVGAHLLGDDAVDRQLIDAVVPARGYPTPLGPALAQALRTGVGLVHLRERVAGTGTAVGVDSLNSAGLNALVVDLVRVAGAAEPWAVLPVAVREALLRGGGIVAGPVEALAEVSIESVRRLADSDVPVILVGSTSWDPRWSESPPLLADAPPLGGAERQALWREELGRSLGSAPSVGMDAALDPGTLAAHLALGPAQVRQAVRAAEASARLRGGPVTAEDLRRGVRAQNASGLERLARRIEPEVGWDDLVLAPAVLRGLRDLAARARHRETVLTDWRMRRGGGRGRGVTALFAGDSGTGKTMSAEVIATDLGLDLYTVNLATVVDKYVGETEKNLERIFVEAAGVNAVLFFDEADAIFGKRSDVRDAHDRYANIESAYLLQRLETFDGLAVLATNLRANIDDAFTRRLDAIIDFPAPTAELRKSLWQHCLAPPLPVSDDIDWEFLADSFELAGGNIRSASTTAAYLAAEAGQPVAMADAVRAVEQEYRKLGRLVLAREFGAYYRLI